MSSDHTGLKRYPQDKRNATVQNADWMRKFLATVETHRSPGKLPTAGHVVMVRGVLLSPDPPVTLSPLLVLTIALLKFAHDVIFSEEVLF